MSKNKNRNNETANYKEVENMSKEIKDVDTEVVDDQEKPEGEVKPETTTEEPKKEGFIERMRKKKWVRVAGYVLAGVASGCAGALIYKHFGTSVDVAEAFQTVQDKIPEGVSKTIETAANNVVRITDNTTGNVDEVAIDKVTTF